jgi:hypothetical protein
LQQILKVGESDVKRRLIDLGGQAAKRSGPFVPPEFAGVDPLRSATTDGFAQL